MRIQWTRWRSRARWANLLALSIALLAGFASWSSVHAVEPLPSDSVYQLDIPLIDQDGGKLSLVARRGRPMLVSMFYTSCKYVCPLIIDTLLKTEHALATPQRARLDVLLVSFDPERDTPARLKNIAVQRKLETPRWTLARTEADNVRKLAALLDIQYRAIADGDFNHSIVLILLDGEGRIVARSSHIGTTDAEFVAAIRQTLDADKTEISRRQESSR